MTIQDKSKVICYTCDKDISGKAVEVGTSGLHFKCPFCEARIS